MDKVKIKFKKLHKDAKLPNKSEGNIGWDFFCVPDDTFNKGIMYNPEVKLLYRRLFPGDRHIFHTGLAYEISEGHAILLWDRSGLSAKEGIHRLAGVCDCSYRAEMLICLINLGHKPVNIHEGDRIAQGIITKEIPIEIEWAQTLSETVRGTKGFGSSGK